MPNKTEDPGAFLSKDPRLDVTTAGERSITQVRLRQGPTREERRTEEELHRQLLATRVEKAIITIAALSIADIAKIIECIGLDLMQHAQETMAEAEGSLNTEFLRKFRAFADRSLGQGAHDILEIQALAKENVMDIIVDSPNFRELPPEKRSLIQRLFGSGSSS
jgi:hypothetical protein